MMNLHKERRQPLRLFWLWLGIGCCLVLFVIYQSLTSSPLESELVTNDKIGHLLAYFFLMAWFVQLYHRRLHLVLLLGFIAMGVVIEILQGQTGHRYFEYIDMLANSSGALIAWLFGNSRLSNLLLQLEQHCLK